MNKIILTLSIALLSFTVVNAQIISDDMESFTLGAIGPQSDAWTTWSGAEGGVEDGIVTDEQAASGDQSVLIAEGQTQDVIVNLGNLTDGDYTISWNFYVPVNATAYYNIQESETPAVAWNLDVFFNQDGTAPGTATIDQDGSTFTYPEGEWFSVSQYVDLTNNTLTLEIDGVVVLDEMDYPGNLGALNFFSIDATNRYYLDDLVFVSGLVGLDELTISDLEIFPNPNNGEFTIVNDSKAGLYTVRVSDLSGRVIMNDAMTLSEGQSRAIVLDNANAGMYLVQLIDEDNATLRVVKMMVK